MSQFLVLWGFGKCFHFLYILTDNVDPELSFHCLCLSPKWFSSLKGVESTKTSKRLFLYGTRDVYQKIYSNLLPL